MTSPRAGAEHFRAVLFNSIGVPVALMACAAGALAFLGERLPAAVPYLVPILGAGALAAVGRSALSRLLHAHEQLHEAVKQRDEALRSCEQQLRAVFDAARDGLLVVDSQGTVLDANAAASVLVGRERAWLLATHFAELCAEESAASLRLTRALRAPCVPVELRLLGSDGTARDVELT
ncbi:MAG TPA: PAS domain-containing protein, partial [Myxococcaceae bacterium]|nr:PAS domain-containing protein [Myxococcaceae bacterium]